MIFSDAFLYPPAGFSGWFITAGYILLALPAAVHILFFKDDERAATGWLGFVLLSPIFGGALYFVFGINRVRQRARSVLRDEKKDRLFHAVGPDMGDAPPAWRTLMQAGTAIEALPYVPGNSIQLLIDGDQAYPAMLEAIEKARHSIVLCSYIFDFDATGRQFVEALGRAQQRDVSVHVLLDGYLLGWRWRRTDAKLRARGISTSRYLPYNPRFANLRNHRKILSIDGAIAFVGGINIRHDNVLQDSPRKPVQDIHFKVEGPVVRQIDEAFIDDWKAATGKKLTLPVPQERAAGETLARVLLEGPDWNYQRLEWTVLTALNAAAHSIRIVTPYFLPDMVLRRAIEGAKLRGVEVEIIIPEKSNIPFFDWAMEANFMKYLEYGIKIFKTPAPFDHSKLVLIDDYWALIGSSNWDARSLALNFEINLECYDPALNGRLSALFLEKRGRARLIERSEVERFSFWRRLRNNFLWLLSPYL